MSDGTTTLRLRRVRFKNGNTVEVLRTKPEIDVSVLLTKSAAIAVEDANIAGFALVAWRSDGEAYIDYHNGPRSAVQAGQVPQYVKDVLLAECAVRWARD